MSVALVLGGGRASRLDGADKASVKIDGVALVDRVYAALRGHAVIAVGPPSLARPGITVVREAPPFGGPVAALAAGLAVTPEGGDEVLVLACDLPRAAGIVQRLSAASFPDAIDALVLRDAGGRMQWLAGRYRLPALRRAVAALPRVDGAAMRAVTDQLRLEAVADHGDAVDLDTWADVERFRADGR
ncbi:molybdenum cofactor guanylyltransferase [Tsukamurella paurometabola]|uniref:Molybdopterin-guanine dinucleotide biosynthesis protein n=1 Tax=Tsukamurella paurometabola (strain ATCC 8368 / DSM 20162 / CCUG 35730 / CIP 100753 / JCM 10117 / KCTC 9821 / NBRC 16120 / NCIMB 702349 / NCTC 13040) TaxID=521096 RepID=D5UQI4_TSUPD|nr:NTP transferase domain-containing protein [Tsukamurella paurometabola]ADG78954.1 molybdopterin-guanine dinucleotide biosynthesis protein [Tsukamurella paurometabola DSM 20162]SUP33607.1 molybdopterin-guanine dinucleotide biosynthesis protein MobA [Tsukamurella paurometabola]